ncbi:hypothetical protein A3C87_01600 [Candidatus Kaiserbacteria bacterium RIFCSPHIGHO2_02_FULL_49_34]|uniref:Plasmid maintenance system killer protein n=1 Tax=Candidatus Kaiserbacteria bacterium RIFCSPHIGHO2_02_FULL_49_34 TaxID=1798491 RepID=A0A1F6DJS5_9BACT|nr:MAG: hypothetical protein A3C87_01600 [Candidatus Kaiserbacteria bacterium RIFCSPHIGHO2_02_FULL_49_34]
MHPQQQEEHTWFAKTKGGEWAEAIWHGYAIKKGFPQNLLDVARRKIVMIDAATELRLLKNPPGNHLEKLRGDRTGQYSVRINDQWRACFVWKGGERPYVHSVEIVDYHS